MYDGELIAPTPGICTCRNSLFAPYAERNRTRMTRMTRMFTDVFSPLSGTSAQEHVYNMPFMDDFCDIAYLYPRPSASSAFHHHAVSVRVFIRADPRHPCYPRSIVRRLKRCSSPYDTLLSSGQSTRLRLSHSSDSLRVVRKKDDLRACFLLTGRCRRGSLVTDDRTREEADDEASD